MIGTFSATLPVFVLIALGYGTARRRFLTSEGMRGLNTFALVVCMPAFLFRTMQSVDFGNAAQWGIWGAYYGAAALIWIFVALFARRIPGLGDAGGAAAAFASTFGNIGMMGVSLSYFAYGEEGVIIAAVIIAIQSSTHWFVGTLWAEWTKRGRHAPLGPMLAGIGVSLVKNPVLVALALGAAWKAGGVETPLVLARTIDLLADAAIPVGLFALGLSVASYPLRENVAGVASIVALKMVVFPGITWMLGFWLFDLSPTQHAVVTVMAAMPTGVNAYLFAARFDASLPAVSGAIGLGVILSVATAPVILWLVGA